jgi:hypothetical protein
LLSTTDRTERGQILVIFGLSLATIIVVAALAFDTGMMLLGRRDQQNAADAAALAGARYLADSPAQDPEDAARAVGTQNGFTDGIDGVDVEVHIPPVSGEFPGIDGFIEVVIHADRPSIFGGIIGAFGWDISARAVAANQPGLDLPFSMLALDPTGCDAIKVTGSGTVESAGTVQVNSACAPNALKVQGTGSLTVTADGAVCNVVGAIQAPSDQLTCTRQPNSYAIKDPLRNLPEPPLPGYPEAINQVGGPARAVPNGCPGSADPADADDPASCTFGGSYSGRTYVLHPGYYPGGLSLGKGTYLLEPGIYYIGGGGFRAAGGDVRSIEACPEVGPCPTTFGGGVMIFNTEAFEFSDECAAGTASNPAVQCIDAVVLNGSVAEVNLKPLADGSNWDGLVVYQDRDLSIAGTDLQINGSASSMEVAGTIYLPSGDVHVNGSTGLLTLDQVIAYTFTVNGDEGEIDVLYRTGVTAHVSGVGLVE